MRRFAKPLYGLTPVPRVRIPPSPPRSLDCRKILFALSPSHANSARVSRLFSDKPHCGERIGPHRMWSVLWLFSERYLCRKLGPRCVRKEVIGEMQDCDANSQREKRKNSQVSLSNGIWRSMLRRVNTAPIGESRSF
jgi:hypothetical protein